MDLVTITLDEVVAAATKLAHRHNGHVRNVYGVPRGGLLPAALVARELDVRLVSSPGANTLVVDDLVDSGVTLSRFLDAELSADALFRKSTSPSQIAPHAELRDGWLVFPWEEQDTSGPTDAVMRLLEYVGEDPARPGLVDTPGRVTQALAEMTSGYGVDVADLLSRTFVERCDEMVLVNGIDFTSLCEHHLLPFVGTVTVGYIPDGYVVGLSKLARLVDAYARRLQVQERMTVQIAEAIQQHVRPLGVGVVVEAHHSCMGCRGVRKPGARMLTSSMLGALRDKSEARAEFLALAGQR